MGRSSVAWKTDIVEGQWWVWNSSCQRAYFNAIWALIASYLYQNTHVLATCAFVEFWFGKLSIWVKMNAKYTNLRSPRRRQIHSRWRLLKVKQHSWSCKELNWLSNDTSWVPIRALRRELWLLQVEGKKKQEEARSSNIGGDPSSWRRNHFLCHN